MLGQDPSPDADRVVVLVPARTTDDGLVDAAVAALEYRLGGEAEVEADGTDIVVTFPQTPAVGKVNALGESNDAHLRPVLAQRDETGTTGDVSPVLADELAVVDCPDPGSAVAPPDQEVVACALDGSSAYVLGPSTLEFGAVTEAQARNGTVYVQFDDAAASTLETLSGEVAQKDPPADQLAVLAAGQVLTATPVDGPLSGGLVQAEMGDQDQALLLLGQLLYGTPVMSYSVS